MVNLAGVLHGVQQVPIHLGHPVALSARLLVSHPFRHPPTQCRLNINRALCISRARPWHSHLPRHLTHRPRQHSKLLRPHIIPQIMFSGQSLRIPIPPQVRVGRLFPRITLLLLRFTTPLRVLQRLHSTVLHLRNFPLLVPLIVRHHPNTHLHHLWVSGQRRQPTRTLPPHHLLIIVLHLQLINIHHQGSFFLDVMLI